MICLFNREDSLTSFTSFTMRTEQLTKCSGPLQVRRLLNRLMPPVMFRNSDHSKAVLLIWLSVYVCFGVGYCTVFIFCLSR